MLRAYKYKIKPNADQKELLSKFFGCARYIYNWGLNIKINAYKESKTSVSYVELAKRLTIQKKQEETIWLNECSNEVLQQSLRNLDSAYSNFFRKQNKFPKFKSKKNCKNSIKFINSVHFDFNEWTVKLPKLGKVKLCKNREFDQSGCRQGTCTVSLDHCGEYWCVILIDNLQEKPEKANPVEETAIGIDMGIKHFATLSDGTKIENPKYLERSQKKLAHLQKVLARKKKDSKNRERMRVKVAKCYRRITRQRTDFLHKLSAELVSSYDTICMETLNVEGMVKNHHLAQSIQSASWSEFVRMVEYKSDWSGRNLIRIDKFEPSSKVCNNCGHIYRDLRLSERKWTCPVCGKVHDRDVNAAVNIKQIAFRKQSA